MDARVYGQTTTIMHDNEYHPCAPVPPLPIAVQVILPVQKALGGDPEAIQARAVLTRYKGQLSAAVAEAAARAAKR